jgi:alkylation response protein AidB-like acyl-CoA dehydrogenase
MSVESVADFRARAREFIRDNLKPINPDSQFGTLRNDRTEQEELAFVARDREVQRMLFDAKLAGVCFPKEYGGLGLTPAHQAALNEELFGFEYPQRIQAPTIAPCASVLLDFGTEEQKQRHIPAILRGEEIWMQLLSEPSSGSDVASALTSAVREGDDWILNGSKIWTTGAWWSDWGLCLARTNWDVPKHRGLTVFMFPLKQEGVAVHRIEMLNGSKEFCQEFLTDVRVPDTDRVGEVDGGWTRWMYHERMLFSSPLVTTPKGNLNGAAGSGALVAVARELGRDADPIAHELVGRARTLELTKQHLSSRIAESMASGRLNDQAAAIGRLFNGYTGQRIFTLEFDLAGAHGAAWGDNDGASRVAGEDFLMRQAASIGGGTLEMARNVISERVLGMPREKSIDKDVPFRDVPRGATSQR